ncbi:MAG: Rgg/GadR/MutR family transcriptional regulator [Enterococcus sp.]
MSIGKTFRAIRLSKGLQQKEIYSGILSKSYAIEFEKGKHNISATLLLSLLERISVEYDEFLFIENNYRLQKPADYSIRYSKYANNHDLPNLYALLAELSASTIQIDKVHSAEIRSRIRIIEHVKKTGEYLPSVALDTDKKIILDYLIDIQTWTLQEIQLFANTLEFITAEQKLIFFKQISKYLPLYENYDRGRDAFCVLLTNLIRETLLENQLDYAFVLIQQLKLISTEYNELYYRVIINYFEGILLMKQGEKARGKDKSLNAIQLLIQLDMVTLVKELESLYPLDLSEIKKP